MKGMILASAALLLAIAVWAGGGDPWKTKAMSQWNDSDIDKALHQSPWSRTVTVEATWKPISESEMDKRMLPGTASGASGGSKGVGGAATVLPAEHSDAQTRGADVSFSVFWMSSRTIRTAMGRRKVLHSGGDEADAEKFATQPLDEYQILLQSQDMAPFYRNEPAWFVQNSSLELKKSKHKISPSRVEYDRDASGRTITAVRFYFPKKAAGGGEFVTAGEKTVEFSCRVGNSTIHADFEPPKMGDQQGPDF
jgi:hypothetical protein